MMATPKTSAEAADQIDLDDAAEIVERHRPVAADDPPAGADPGAAHRDPRRSVLLARGGDGALDACRIGDVAGERQAAYFLRRLGRRRRMDVENRDLHPGRRQCPRRCPAEPRSAAADERRPSADFHPALLSEPLSTPPPGSPLPCGRAG